MSEPIPAALRGKSLGEIADIAGSIPPDQITQDDRDAAAPFLRSDLCDEANETLVAAFARHRLSASRQPEAVVREALERLAESIKQNMPARLAEAIPVVARALCEALPDLPAPQPRDDDAGQSNLQQFTETARRIEALASPPSAQYIGVDKAGDYRPPSARQNGTNGEPEQAARRDFAEVLDAHAPAIRGALSRQDGPGLGDRELLAEIRKTFERSMRAPWDAKSEPHPFSFELSETGQAYRSQSIEDAFKNFRAGYLARARSTPTPDSPEVERLREALRPFAAVMDKIAVHSPQWAAGQHAIDVGAFSIELADFRCAAEALAAVPQEADDAKS